MPRVARHELPWVKVEKFRQPQRGCVGCAVKVDTTPLGLKKFWMTFTQGSSCLATLGFEPESLWDSSAAAFCFWRDNTRNNFFGFM